MSKFNIEKLGADLYSARGSSRKKKSIETVATEIQVNKTTLSNIERGIYANYTGEVLLKVVQFIGSKLDDYVE